MERRYDTDGVAYWAPDLTFPARETVLWLHITNLDSCTSMNTAMLRRKISM